MKKIISFYLLALLLCSTAYPAFGQKRRLFPSTPLPTSTVKAEARFATARAYTDGRGTWFEWTMESEKENAGFFLYRIAKRGIERVPGVEMVGGSAMRVGAHQLVGSKYNAFRASGDLRAVYFVESLLMDGTRIAGPTFAAEYVSDLRPIAGATSSELAERDSSANRTTEKNGLALPKELKKEVASYVVEADDTTHRAVISRPGVKIAVRNEGLYHITKNELQAGGFDTNGNPDLWQLYVEGIEQPMIVGPNGSFIEFYGVGTDTVETDIRTYFLIAGDGPGKRMATKVARPSVGTVVSRSYAQTYTKAENIFYVDSIINGDAENYFGTFISSGGATVTFDLSGVDTSAASANITIALQGYSIAPHSVEMILNGQSLPTASWNGNVATLSQHTVPVSALREGENILQLRSVGAGNDTSFFDTISVGYMRKFVAEANKIRFYTDNYRIAKLEGFTSPDVRIFDITDRNAPALMTNLNIVQKGSTYGADLPAARGRVLYGVENSALLQPVSIEANNPALISDSTGADLIIISYKDFMTPAEAWANYRRGQGFTVNVVDVREIYDEFGYGAAGWRPVNAFLSYAYTNWATRPKYVLLIGDGSFDPKNYRGLGNQNLIPVRIVNTIYSETASDEALCDFDNDGLAELAVGRIPAISADAVTTLFNKTTAWEAALTASPLNRGALFAYDFPNGYDFEGMSVRLRDKLPAGTPYSMVYRGSTDSANTLLSEMNTGKYIVNYSGHGSTGSWGGNPVFFNLFSVPNLTNANNNSIFTILSCLNGYFHNPFEDSLAERLVKATNGGAVAVWSSSGLTTPDVQEVMGGRFYSQIGAGTIPRLGDLIRDAKTFLNGGTDVRRSWVLIGDPMLKVR